MNTLINLWHKIASSTKFQQIHIFLSRLDIPATFFNVQYIFRLLNILVSMVSIHIYPSTIHIQNIHFTMYTSKECVLFVEEYEIQKKKERKKKWFQSTCAQSKNFCSVSGQHIQSYSCYNTLCPGYTIVGIEPS